MAKKPDVCGKGNRPKATFTTYPADTERRHAEDTMRLAHHFLEIANRHSTHADLLNELVFELQEFTGCEAVGIRLLREEELAYEASIGFAEEFHRLDGVLSVKRDNCLCTRIIEGRLDESQPFVTQGGAFWTSDLRKLFETHTNGSLSPSRGYCPSFGYASMALIPIRVGGHVIGLIHLADSRIETVSLPMVNLIEGITIYLGTAIERVSIEEDLQGSERRYRAIVQHQTELVCRFLDDGTLTFVNDAFCAYCRKPANALLGNSFMLLFPKEDHDEVAMRIASTSLKPDDPVVIFERRMVGQSGAIRWFLWTNRAIYDATGRLIEYQSVGRDITEHRQADEALRASEERYRAFVAQSSEGIWRFETEEPVATDLPELEQIERFYEVAYTAECNAVFARTFGFETPDQAIGARIDAILPAEDPKSLDIALAWIRADYRLTDAEFTLTDKEGQELTLLINMVGVVEGGCVHRAWGIFRDVTERRRSTQALLSASRMEATSILAGGIAHQFNNLMEGILGNASLLREDLGSGHPNVEMIEEIGQAAEEAGTLTQQLLGFARSGRYQPSVLNLNAVVRETLLLDDRAIPSRIRIENRLDGDLHKIEADLTQITLVLLNLVSNAVEAVEGEGCIGITTRNITVDRAWAKAHGDIKAGEHVCLTVQDDGCGMSPTTLTRIYEPFFTTKSHGRGLGLASVYGIVTNHGGAICSESRPGAGTRFDIYLPAVESRSGQTAPPPTEMLRGTETILVVDDNHIVLRSTAALLRHMGYVTLLAQDGEEALDLLAKDGANISLVLLDMIMPNMGGDQAFPLIKKLCPHVKVVLFSGYELDAASRALLEAGADGFVQKPAKRDHLLTVIRESIDGQMRNGL